MQTDVDNLFLVLIIKKRFIFSPSGIKISYLRPFAHASASFQFLINNFYYFGHKYVKTTL